MSTATASQTQSSGVELLPEGTDRPSSVSPQIFEAVPQEPNIEQAADVVSTVLCATS